MNIPENDPIRLLESYLHGLKPPEKGEASTQRPLPESPPEEGQVRLSGKARSLQRLSEAVSSVPEVREERVAELRRQVEDGQYTVQGEKVLEKLLRSALFDRLL